MKYDIDKFFDLSVDLLCIAGVDGYFKKINPAFSRILGYSQNELLGKPFIAFIHPEDLDSTIQEVEKLKAGEPTILFDNRYKTAKGDYKWLRWTSYPEKETGLLYSVARDITDIKNAENRFHIAVEASPSAMIIVNDREEIIFLNQQTERIFGYSKDELIGHNFHLLISKNIHQEHHSLHNNFIQNVERRLMGIGRSLKGIHKNGREIPVEIGLNPVHTTDGILVICGINDLSERFENEQRILQQQKRLEDANHQLEQLATTDTLTALKNRRALFDEFEVLLNYTKRFSNPLSVIILDIDHFKEFNDLYGHQAGDDVLKLVASCLMQSARQSDIVARYGGEEFCTLLPNTDRKGSEIAAEKMRINISKYPWRDKTITASFGISTYMPGTTHPGSTIDANFLLSCADKALYHAKKSGRNRIIHYQNI